MADSLYRCTREVELDNERALPRLLEILPHVFLLFAKNADSVHVSSQITPVNKKVEHVFVFKVSIVTRMLVR